MNNGRSKSTLTVRVKELKSLSENKNSHREWIKEIKLYAVCIP